jgi:hypothetical protein
MIRDFRRGEEKGQRRDAEFAKTRREYGGLWNARVESAATDEKRGWGLKK